MGYGIIAFMDTHLWLILMMLTIILIQIPFMYQYKNFQHGNRKASGTLHSYSLGNLGFANPLCKDTTLGSGRIVLSCSTGEISEIHDFGVTPDNAKYLDPCKQNKETEECEWSIDRNYMKTYIEG